MGTINYCDKCGNCSRCGNCCAAMIPLTREEEETIRKYIHENKIEPEYFQDEKNMNLQCCFYDRTNKKCKIYEVRPNICKSYKCNRKELELNKERDNNHKKAYWNNITNGKENNITDMRLLFYNDPRSLLANLIYAITNGTMECNIKQFEYIKQYLIDGGQEELARCIKGTFDD